MALELTYAAYEHTVYLHASCYSQHIQPLIPLTVLTGSSLQWRLGIFTVRQEISFYTLGKTYENLRTRHLHVFKNKETAAGTP